MILNSTTRPILDQAHSTAPNNLGCTQTRFPLPHTGVWRCCLPRRPVATCSSHCSMRTAAATLAVGDQINRSRPLYCQTHHRNPDQYSSPPANNSPRPSTTATSLSGDAAGFDYKSQLAAVTAACDRWQ